MIYEEERDELDRLKDKMIDARIAWQDYGETHNEGANIDYSNLSEDGDDENMSPVIVLSGKNLEEYNRLDQERINAMNEYYNFLNSEK